MALYDWNHDGRKDWQDDYIEYEVYKDMAGRCKQKSSAIFLFIVAYGNISL